MNLRLEKKERIVAECFTRDDSFELWSKASQNREYMKRDLLDREKLICGAFASRHSIRSGEEYLRLEFSDIDTGDTFVMNCSIQMHKVMMKTNTYPDFITKAVSEYDNKNVMNDV